MESYVFHHLSSSFTYIILLIKQCLLVGSSAVDTSGSEAYTLLEFCGEVAEEGTWNLASQSVPLPPGRVPSTVRVIANNSKAGVLVHLHLKGEKAEGQNGEESCQTPQIDMLDLPQVSGILGVLLSTVLGPEEALYKRE